MKPKRDVSPRMHTVKVRTGSPLKTEVWSYASPKSREVYVEVTCPQGHHMLVSFRVPR